MFLHRKIKKEIQHWIQKKYDAWICTPEHLINQPIKRSPRGGRKISVAIPHWNRGALIHRPLWNIVNDERIEEIVIVDDGSSEEEFALLTKNVTRYDQRNVVTIHRREENRGAQFTKIECVEKIVGEWMILLDSDNTLFSSYLNAVVSLNELDEKSLYCPDWAFPYFCFHQLRGKKIDFQKTCHLAQNGILQKIYLLNDGNYFFHKTTYLNQLSSLKQIENDVADVILANYSWLSQGGFLTVLQGARYLHRIDDSSFWLRTSEESKKRLMTIFDRLKKNLPWNDAFEKI
jgi:glycosyltransferase involved in cell wall biosynthesis